MTDTTKQIEQERAAFEAWVRETNKMGDEFAEQLLLRAPDTHGRYYIVVRIESAWQAWLAARATPSPVPAEPRMIHDGKGELVAIARKSCAPAEPATAELPPLRDRILKCSPGLRLAEIVALEQVLRNELASRPAPVAAAPSAAQAAGVVELDNLKRLRRYVKSSAAEVGDSVHGHLATLDRLIEAAERQPQPAELTDEQIKALPLFYREGVENGGYVLLSDVLRLAAIQRAAPQAAPSEQAKAAHVEWRNEKESRPAQGEGLTVQRATDEIMYHVANEPDRVKVRAIVENTVATIAAHTRASDGKDSERLEFMLSNFTRCSSLDMSGNHAWSGVGRYIGRGTTPRKAIDAAMQQAASSQQEGA